MPAGSRERAEVGSLAPDSTATAVVVELLGGMGHMSVSYNTDTTTFVVNIKK